MQQFQEQTDVLVAGGGPAGLLAAQVVAASGRRVVVFEREPEIGTPVHTSGALAIDVMRQFDIPIDLYHPISRLRLCSPNETAIFEFPEPVGCVIDVHGLYQHLAGKAQLAGARIETSASVVRPILYKGQITGCWIRSEGIDRAVSAKVVIDATGYRADLSRAAGLHTGFSRFGVGAEYELIAPSCRQDEAVVLVGNRYAPAGYAWVFPWGKNRVRIGVGLLHSDTRADARKLIKTFMADLHKFDVDVRGSEITETHFGLIPAMGLAKRLSGRGIMAVGDAAGVATLVVGEGIRLSMISGELAGRTAVAALSRGGLKTNSLRAYERAFKAKFGRDLRIGKVINRRIASWSDTRWDEAVRLLRTIPVRTVVAVLQSDFSIKDVVAWLAMRPSQWPRLARWTAKTLLDYVRT